jgi:O-antigen biosynthesis protein WbqP
MLKTSQRVYLILKRAIDIFGSVLGIVILSPVLLFCAIMTKCTSQGPVIFKQERLGLHKKPFVLYKFRSMKCDAPQFTPANTSCEQQKSYTTKWGEFMRKSSLDELPQLFDILLGEMSFVGPRPSQTESIEAELVAARDSYLPSAYEVKPGLGGYAQIHMKREHDIYEKAKEDSYYVQNMSLVLDTKVFLYSFLCLFGVTKGR